MKSLLEWRLERMLEDIDPSQISRDNSPGVPQRPPNPRAEEGSNLDPNVLRVISKVVPPLRAEFQDPQDAIEAIALSCVVALSELGRSDSIEKIKKALDAQSPRGPLMSGVPR